MRIVLLATALAVVAPACTRANALQGQCTGACDCTDTTCTCAAGGTCTLGGGSADSDGGSGNGSSSLPTGATFDCQHMNTCIVDCGSDCTSHCAS
ncbi:MAG: hypothetical protein ACXVAN_12435, partial [Polyangia bacterium]